MKKDSVYMLHYMLDRAADLVNAVNAFLKGEISYSDFKEISYIAEPEEALLQADMLARTVYELLNNNVIPEGEEKEELKQRVADVQNAALKLYFEDMEAKPDYMDTVLHPM